MAMSKVVSINNRKFLGDYYARSSNNIPDEAVFFAGIIVAKVLPELICIVYGGLIPLIAFTITAISGTTWGLVKYYKFPFETISCVNTGTVPQAPPSESKALRKAA
jgi:hypothetical protein